MKSEERFYQFVTMGLFEIKDNGEVWRIARRDTSGKANIIKLTPKRVGRILQDGYWGLSSKIGSKTLNVRIHRLVYFRFYGSIPDGFVIDHIDHNPLNNHPSNLQAISYSENIRRSPIRKARLARGEKHPHSKLTNAQVKQIRKEYAAGGITQKDLGTRYGIHPEHIGCIVRKEKWKHV